MTNETVEQFEHMIYLPMLLTILDKDTKQIEATPVKFTSPYLAVVKRAMNNIHNDLKDIHQYFNRNRMKLIKEGNDGDFTTYLFSVGSERYQRKYMNLKLRNHSQELLEIYLMGGSVRNGEIKHVTKGRTN
ncbi:hypothetical protein [Sporosarcina sp. SAFN-010]|uniref:hypothetical protein n=1 Tax=Sporosarcina sp. SAFN-010 TaxID=3387273 RepID=UPI003F808F43